MMVEQAILSLMITLYLSSGQEATLRNRLLDYGV
jgi:hypothetical protein